MPMFCIMKTNYRISAQILLPAFLLTLCVCLPVAGTMAVEISEQPKNILVFGGNGFIGSAVVGELLKAGTYSLTLVNRGNWYWDSSFLVEPFVKNIKCDRQKDINLCLELQDFVSSTEMFDVVLDFSGYHVDSIRDSLDLVGRKTKLYIFISTDSVYEVCDKQHQEATKEVDSVRPDNEELRLYLIGRDDYGHRKLECEEMLIQYRNTKDGPPFIILRLPDVIGPRDNTYRWWIYQLWIKLEPYLQKKVTIPTAIASKPISLVFVDDIAKLIRGIVNNTAHSALDQIFNLALLENPTVLELLELIKAELNVTDVEISVADTTSSVTLYPSVYSGILNISKAQDVLSWSPTELKQVVKETVRFYEEAIKTMIYDRPRKEIIRTIQAFFTDQPRDVIRGLNSVYDLRYPEPKDEL